ncbi:MAG: zinc-dependent alcohol dehydrogenase [Pseudomonadota bacterium]
MQQLYYVSPGVLEWRERPDACLENDADAIVRPLAVTRCDLDLSIATGAAGWPGGFAFGHETYGEVVDVGDAVKAFRPGDRVLVPFQISCGACGRCRQGLTALCETVPYRSSYGMAPLSGVDYGGGLADRLRVPFADHMLVPAPSNLAPEALAGVADNVTNALAFVAEPLRERPGASLLIVGGARGGIAFHAIQCALGLGAKSVVYVGDDPATLEVAGRLGATTVEMTVGPDTPPVGQFPLTLDASGSEDGLAFAIRCTDYEGLCQRTYGDFRERTPTPLKDMYGRHITLKLGRVHARAQMPATLDLMRRGCLCPEHVITRRATFAEAPEAMLDPTHKVVFLCEDLAT